MQPSSVGLLNADAADKSLAAQSDVKIAVVHRVGLLAYLMPCGRRPSIADAMFRC